MTTSTAPPTGRHRRQARPAASVTAIFADLARGAGVLILVVLAGVAAVPDRPGDPGVRRAHGGSARTGMSLVAYIGPLIFGTLLSSIIALIIGDAARRRPWRCSSRTTRRARLAQGLSYVVDLLAAVPSIVYGLWGAITLAPASLRPRRPGSTSTSAGCRSSPGRCRPPGARCSSSGIVAGGDDPPDHHRGLARGVPADAQAARGGGARAGRHPLGDDPDGRAAVRPLRRHQRRDARPRAARWARRWPSRSSCRRRGVVTFNLISSDNPSTIAAQHRPAVPGVHRPRGERAHRVRPGAVRDHPAGQRRSRAGSSTVGASSRGRTDDASIRREAETRPGGGAAPSLAKRGELPALGALGDPRRRPRRRRRAAGRHRVQHRAVAGRRRPSCTRSRPTRSRAASRAGARPPTGWSRSWSRSRSCWR